MAAVEAEVAVGQLELSVQHKRLEAAVAAEVGAVEMRQW